MERRPGIMARIGVQPLVWLVQGLILLLRLIGPSRASGLGGFIARRLGPFLGVHKKVGLANLRAVFPEKSAQEHERLLRSVWDNLGRTVAEYPFLKDLVDYDPNRPLGQRGSTEIVGREHFEALAARGGPALIFSAHLANWEVLGVAAEKYGLGATVLFRPPNNPIAASLVAVLRQQAMGRMIATTFGSSVAINETLKSGGILAMLVDQHFTLGVTQPFLGRDAVTNPLIVRLARRFDCPVHGARCIRLPNGAFRLEFTPPIHLPRDAEGLIDISAGVRVINDIVAGWVLEHPEQWLWLHRRWREKPGTGKV